MGHASIVQTYDTYRYLFDLRDNDKEALKRVEVRVMGGVETNEEKRSANPVGEDKLHRNRMRKSAGQAATSGGLLPTSSPSGQT